MTDHSKTISKELLEKAYDYRSFNQKVNSLFEEGRSTNDDNSESMLNYTRLNIRRTDRWDKRAKLTDELKARLAEFPVPMSWLVITEGWCGDSAQILPFLHKMEEASSDLSLHIILRDEHPEVMDEFLTDGARSIPKIIALNSDNLEILGSWGPRPSKVQQVYMDERNNPAIENQKASENLHLWYARDKGSTLQEEFTLLLDQWADEVLVS